MYVIEWNLDNVIKDQPKLSKTFNPSWDGEKWIIPKEQQDIYCGPASIVGSIKGYTRPDVNPINAIDISILQDILAGNSPMPSNICCIDADADGSFTQTDIDLVQNFVNGTSPTGNVNKLCSEIAG